MNALELVYVLREYADVAEAGDKVHWAKAMRDAANILCRNTHEADFFQMVKTFIHLHINNGKDDACEQCGLDLRHPVHRRIRP